MHKFDLHSCNITEKYQTTKEAPPQHLFTGAVGMDDPPHRRRLGSTEMPPQQLIGRGQG